MPQIATRQKVHHSSNDASNVRALTGQLSYYYARGLPNGSGASNFGLMCERLSEYVHASHRCRLCREFPGVAPDGTDCVACSGSGYTKPTRAKSRLHREIFATVRCWRCRGCGEALGKDRTPGTLTSYEYQDVCRRCMGDACTVPITVRPTGSSKKGKMPKREQGELEAPPKTTTGAVCEASQGESGEWLDEQALAQFGRMSRITAEVRRRDPVSAAVLERYYGSDGDRWGAHAWGREFVLWPLTKPGQKLAQMGAQRSKSMHGLVIPDIDLIASERSAEQGSQVPNLGRRNTMMQARQAARRLLDTAHSVLSSAASGSR